MANYTPKYRSSIKTLDDLIASDKRFQQSAEIYRAIYNLSLDCMSAPDIARQLGQDEHAVAGRIRRMRLAGVLPPFRQCWDDKHGVGTRICAAMRERHGKKLGTLSSLAQLLTSDEIEWMYSEVPYGSTVAEFLASLVRDAYAEEGK